MNAHDDDTPMTASHATRPGRRGQWLGRLVAAAVPLAALVLIPPAAAEGQIYSWRDADGILVLSDLPRSPEAETVSVEKVTRIRTTRPARPRAANRYDAMIERHARARGVSPDLVRAVIQVESGFDPRAVSPKGALGLMQLMPATASELGVTNPFDPDQNIRGGVTYLRTLLTRYRQDERLALAAYNAGPGAVARHGGQVPPYDETRDFIGKVTATKSPRAPGTTIYKVIDTSTGRPVPRYTNVRPATGTYQVATPPR